MDAEKNWFGELRRKIAHVVDIGSTEDVPSRAYDFAITAIILVNLTVAVLSTFDSINSRYGTLLDTLESVTVALFALDYILRLLSAKYLFPRPSGFRSLLVYIFSFAGIIDLLSFLPHYLPFFLPAGAVAFRMFRVIRIFRLFRITAYYDSLSAITGVLSSKRQQLLSSVFIILVLMLASSLCMYSVEHAAQPEVFQNAFSGIWWSVSTLLTVGYGDIYPITPLGKALGTVITFLGVGMVAIPTGIISAGFVEQYSRMQSNATMAQEQDVHFIKCRLSGKDDWTGKTVRELELPEGVVLAAVHRGHDVLIPDGTLKLEADDVLVIGSDAQPGTPPVELRKVVLLEKSPWNGQYIRDLDISRQCLIVMVKRNGKLLPPKGSTRLRAGDTLLLHTKENAVPPHSTELTV
ncbi:MAG: ion transporter [Clostridia bacterium]|nr:ion transporter [Clostridia bacterium]MBQ6426817.1 ion transporter [Clostridia bacterium]MBQ9910248.1 ion transporter [Lachnospiraceae bacterium]MBR0445314.1 ion transporter [Clostridia bacterium]